MNCELQSYLYMYAVYVHKHLYYMYTVGILYVYIYIHIDGWMYARTYVFTLYVCAEVFTPRSPTRSLFKPYQALPARDYRRLESNKPQVPHKDAK